MTILGTFGKNFFKFLPDLFRNGLCTELGIFALRSVHQDTSFELSKTVLDYFSDFSSQGGTLIILDG